MTHWHSPNIFFGSSMWKINANNYIYLTYVPLQMCPPFSSSPLPQHKICIIINFISHTSRKMVTQANYIIVTWKRRSHALTIKICRNFKVLVKFHFHLQQDLQVQVTLLLNSEREVRFHKFIFKSACRRSDVLRACPVWEDGMGMLTNKFWKSHVWCKLLEQWYDLWKHLHLLLAITQPAATSLRSLSGQPLLSEWISLWKSASDSIYMLNKRYNCIGR